MKGPSKAEKIESMLVIIRRALEQSEWFDVDIRYPRVHDDPRITTIMIAAEFTGRGGDE